MQLPLQALILSINEKYLKSGQPAKFPRRDLRRGQLEGKFSVSTEGHPVVSCASSLQFTPSMSIRSLIVRCSGVFEPSYIWLGVSRGLSHF